MHERPRTVVLLILATGLGGGTLHAATPEFQAAVLLDTPILYYQLNEDSGAALNLGSLGSAFDATYFGSPLRQAPATGGESGVSFDGSDDFLESGATAPAGLTGNPTFTAEAVVLVPPSGTVGLWAPFLHWGPSPPGSATAKSVYFSFSNDAPTEAYVGFYNGGLQSPTGSMAKDWWHHLVWVRVGGGNDQVGSTLYLDGVDISSSLVPDPQLCCNGSTPIVESTEFRINRARDFDGSRFFVGTLDEVVLYDRALTPAEVATHWEALGFLFRDNFESADFCRWSTPPPGACPP
ncbi:MAG: LamG-like jellyroll fold domain-containing protein [Thermoanaerobaculia bacterium]